MNAKEFANRLTVLGTIGRSADEIELMHQLTNRLPRACAVEIAYDDNHNVYTITIRHHDDTFITAIHKNDIDDPALCVDLIVGRTVEFLQLDPVTIYWLSRDQLSDGTTIIDPDN